MSALAAALSSAAVAAALVFGALTGAPVSADSPASDVEPCAETEPCVDCERLQRQVDALRSGRDLDDRVDVPIFWFTGPLGMSDAVREMISEYSVWACKFEARAPCGSVVVA